MSYTPEQLLEILSNYEKLTDNSLLKNAKKKVDSKKKSTKEVDKKDKKTDSHSAKDSKESSKEKKSNKKSSVKKRAALFSRFNLQQTNPAITSIAVRDSLLQKYSEEGQVIDRLIAKYSQLNLPDTSAPDAGGENNQSTNNSPEALAYYSKNLAEIVQKLGTEFSQYLGKNQALYNKVLEGAKGGNVSKEDLNQLMTAVDEDLKAGNNGQPAEGDMKATLEKVKGSAQTIMNVLPKAQNQSVKPADPNANDPSMGPVYNPAAPGKPARPAHKAVGTKAGYNVKQIQQTLQARDKSVNLGPTGADGDWGKLTEAAFQKWKATNNLQAVTDDEAIKRLMSGDNSSMQKAPAGPPAPIPAPPVVAPKAPPQQLSEVPLHINQLVQQTGQLFQQAQKMEQTVGKKQIQNPAQIQQWFQTVQHLEKQVANAKAWGNRLPPQSANAAAGAETQLNFIKDILNRLVKQTKGMG
jgi:hypothetical protein